MKGFSPVSLFSTQALNVGIFSAAINILLLVMPIFMLQIYDRVLPASNVDTLLYISIAALLALVFLGLLEVTRSIYSQRIAGQIDREFASKAFQASLFGPRAETGEIQPLRDLATVRSFIGSKGLSTLLDLPFVPLFVILLWFIHPALCLLTIAGALVLVVLVFLTQKANGKNASDASEQSARANLMAQALARNGDTLRAMGMSRNITENWGRKFADALIKQDRATKVGSIFGGISRCTRMLLQLAILGLGAWLVLQGKMTAGMIFASSIISGRALQPLDQLIAGWRQTVDAQRAWQRLNKALQDKAPHGTRKLQLPEPAGKLGIRDLVYVPPGSPPGSEPIIKRISFEVEAGETVAIIGPSRAGKSTLARLLAGAIPPTSGSVQVDGADTRTWDDVQLGGYVGYLAQDVQLLPGSVAENLSRFSETGEDASVVDAAKRAGAHELILSLRDGYQTQVGSSNSTLSGGERQRIGLARAFFRTPRILILDEPNSNLDVEGEAALVKALADAKALGTTIILITHRLSLAATCGRTLLLRNGTIAAIGPTAEILQKLGAVGDKPSQRSTQSKSLVTSSSAHSEGGPLPRWSTTLKTGGA